MATTITCDQCGTKDAKEIILKVKIQRVSKESEMYWTDYIVDLCDKCYTMICNLSTKTRQK